MDFGVELFWFDCFMDEVKFVGVDGVDVFGWLEIVISLVGVDGVYDVGVDCWRDDVEFDFGSGEEGFGWGDGNIVGGG